jgi:hypothetical protein
VQNGEKIKVEELYGISPGSDRTNKGTPPRRLVVENAREVGIRTFNGSGDEEAGLGEKEPLGKHSPRSRTPERRTMHGTEQQPIESERTGKPVDPALRLLRRPSCVGSAVTRFFLSSERSSAETRAAPRRNPPGGSIRGTRMVKEAARLGKHGKDGIP